MHPITWKLLEIIIWVIVLIILLPLLLKVAKIIGKAIFMCVGIVALVFQDYRSRRIERRDWNYNDLPRDNDEVNSG